ncbi:MAG: hypothetical protein L0H59_00055 [Tomitella sp.]|nr:hypothetical protein [Tomitella sp.]
MRRLTRALTEVAAAGAAAAIAVAMAAIPATAAPPATLSIDGHLQPVPNLNILHITATGEQSADGTATGSYTAQAEFGNMPLPITVAGPITCLSFDGPTASLIYPITGTDPMLVPGSLSGAAAVQITVTQGHGGGPDHVGLIGPMPTSNFHGCAPGPTPFVFDGTIDIAGG